MVLLIGICTISQTSAGWLVNSSSKITPSDRIQIRNLLKYQEPLIKHTGNTSHTNSNGNTNIGGSTNTVSSQELQNQLNTAFANLQKSIATKNLSTQANVYSTLISRIKNIQSSYTDLSDQDTFTLSYLLKKAEDALKIVQGAIDSGDTDVTIDTTSSGSTIILSGEKKIGGLTLSPASYTNDTSTGVILGKFSVSQDMTLHHLDLTVSSDAPIDMSGIIQYAVIEKAS